jgi:hypothetical protein
LSLLGETTHPDQEGLEREREREREDQRSGQPCCCNLDQKNEGEEERRDELTRVRVSWTPKRTWMP